MTIQTFGPDSDNLSKEEMLLLTSISRPRARLNGLQIQWLSRPLKFHKNITYLSQNNRSPKGI